MASIKGTAKTGKGKLTFRAKMTLLVGILLVLSATSSGVGIWKMAILGNKIIEIAEQDIPMTEILTQITIHQLESAIWFERSFRYMELGDIKSMKKAGEKFWKYGHMADDEFVKGRKMARSNMENAASEEAKNEFMHIMKELEKIEKEHKEYEDHVADLYKFAEANVGKENFRRDIEEMCHEIELEEEQIDEELIELLFEIEEFTKAAALKAEFIEKRGIVLMIIVTLASLALGIGISYIIAKNVLVQVGGDPADVEKLIRQVSEGDFTVETNVKGATGIFASMLKMIESQRDMLADVKNGVGVLTASSQALTEVSGKITTNSEEATLRANSVSAAAEEMSANMNSVAGNTEQTTSSIQLIVSATKDMTEAIEEVSKNTAVGSETTSKAVEEARNVSEKVYALGDAASDITKVTEAISDISEQTNLLALNATIESARAGEAGKGFAVVAGEIKALANQTAQATGEINSKIVAIQTTTQESVEAIESIVGVISEINSIVSSMAAAIEEQSATTREISTNVDTAAESLGDVSARVTETATVAGEVTKDIAEVSQTNTRMNIVSQEVEDNSGKLLELSGELTQLVERFKL
ncbi:MAG: methyl-accepting chemotaxis protein [Desulfobacter sp.]